MNRLRAIAQAACEVLAVLFFALSLWDCGANPRTGTPMQSAAAGMFCAVASWVLRERK